jgi:hypothetical protein
MVWSRADLNGGIDHDDYHRSTWPNAGLTVSYLASFATEPGTRLKGIILRLPKAMTAVALAMAATLLTTGCSKGGAPATPDTSPATTDAVGQAAAGAKAPDPTASAPAVIATTEGQISYAGKVIPLKIELLAPRREQGFVTVRVRLTNLTPKGTGGTLGWQVGSDFSSETRGPHGKDNFSGVYLLDRKNSKQYLVARNSEGEFLASHSLNTVFVRDQQTTELYATLGAPPADVTTVDIFVPKLPAFENVPLG